MNTTYKVGGTSLIFGALLLTAYAVLFHLLLPSVNSSTDYVQAMLDPDWSGLAFISLLGVLLMLVGFHATYLRLRSSTSWIASVGYFFVTIAYVFQACKITWELLLYPIIASHPETSFLLRETVIYYDPGVVAFRITSSITIFVGIILFCLALYRSNDYPKISAILIFFGSFVYALGPILSMILSLIGIFTFAIGCLLLGMHLFQLKQEQVSESATL